LTKIVIASFSAILVAAVAVIALGGDNGAAGQVPTDTPTDTATATAEPTATATDTPTATATGTATAAAGTASPSPAQPVAAPQTGGEPGSGASDTLVLTLLLGAATVIGAAGVLGARYALERRS
jgi:carbohydrate-binding DOMON domain-containing protein